LSHQGFPLRTITNIIIEPKSQVIVPSGIEFSIPKEFIIKISSFNSFRIEPLIAPGIILPGHCQISLLLANLTSDAISISKGQVVLFAHFTPLHCLLSTCKISPISDFNLPLDHTTMVIPSEQYSHLSSEQQAKVTELFSKYKNVFSTDKYDLGLAKNVSHSVDTEGQKPISLRPYRRSIAAEQEVNEEISELIDQGLLIPLRSPWASPVLVVKKKDGTNLLL